MLENKPYFNVPEPGWEGQAPFDETADSSTLMNDPVLTTIEELGKNIEALGKAFQDPNSNLSDLVVLAARCGLILRMQFVQQTLINPTQDEVKNDLQT